MSILCFRSNFGKRWQLVVVLMYPPHGRDLYGEASIIGNGIIGRASGNVDQRFMLNGLRELIVGCIGRFHMGENSGNIGTEVTCDMDPCGTNSLLRRYGRLVVIGRSFTILFLRGMREGGMYPRAVENMIRGGWTLRSYV